MCGIAGIYDVKEQAVDESLVRSMTEGLSHRGPDAQAYAGNGSVVLGHCRLSIIDLVTGAQPMTSADGRYTVVYNGEIFNFREIRAALEAKGRRFRTQSDTESLLQLYEEKGAECVRELEGMFAFAIHDRREKSVFLAVDRFGKKPLYYTQAGSRFAFASELKSLLKLPGIEKTVDDMSLSQYLAFEYVPAPRTICKNIFKMEAATTLTVSEKGLSKNVYWKPQFSSVEKSEDAWTAEFTNLLRSSVDRRLISDVPLGVFLSGGLDSSSVLALSAELYPGRKIKTFSIGFDEPDFDESRYARMVSEHFGTEHVTERCSLSQMREEHAKILSTLDEPMADASYIPTYMLCRLTRKHVTVALSGDGGDELLFGYPTFQAHCLAEKFEYWPQWMLRAAAGAANALPTSMGYMSLDFKAKQFFKGYFSADPERQQTWLGAFTPAEQVRLLVNDRPVLKAYEPLNELSKDISDSFKKLQEFYFHFYLQGDILVKVDRASMANSLEVRSPFLDERLVAAVFSMPRSLLMNKRTGKVVLKKAMASKLPGKILSRPKKGFGIPISEWIRQELRPQFEEMLSESRLKKDGFFDAQEVRRLLDEHIQGKRDNRKALWTLYVFQHWKQNWL